MIDFNYIKLRISSNHLEIKSLLNQELINYFTNNKLYLARIKSFFNVDEVCRPVRNVNYFMEYCHKATCELESLILELWYQRHPSYTGSPKVLKTNGPLNFFRRKYSFADEDYCCSTISQT